MLIYRFHLLYSCGLIFVVLMVLVCLSWRLSLSQGRCQSCWDRSWGSWSQMKSYKFPCFGTTPYGWGNFVRRMSLKSDADSLDLPSWTYQTLCRSHSKDLWRVTCWLVIQSWSCDASWISSYCYLTDFSDSKQDSQNQSSSVLVF